MGPCCPICSLVLSEKKIGSAAYLTCELHGVWTNLGFFSKFKNARVISIELFQSRRFVFKSSEAPLHCPSCYSFMTATEYKKVPGLILDQCFRCNGVWFDNGELNAIPQKAELEADFQHQNLQNRFRNEEKQNLSLNLPDSMPETSINPLMFFGLPAEESRVNVGMSVANIAIILFCVFVSFKGFHSQAFFESGAFDPRLPFRNHGITWLTSIFLHGGFFHLFSNIYFLYICGDDIDAYKGPIFLTVLFFAAAFCGNLLYLLGGGTIPTIGASGGVAGLLAYYSLAFPKNRFRFLSRFGFSTYSLPAPVFLIFFLFIQIMNFYLVSSAVTHSRVNYLAHIGGITVGLVAYLLSDKSDSR